MSVFLKDLGNFIAKASGKKSAQSLNFLFPSEGQEFKLRRKQDPKGLPVLDPIGLSRLLKLISTSEGLSLDYLEEKARASKLGSSYPRSKIDRMQNGVTAVYDQDFSSLGTIYDCESLLFYNYIVPPFMYAIAVGHKEDGGDRESDQTETDKEFKKALNSWLAIPDDVVRGPDSNSLAKAWVPMRRLTGTAVATVLLELPHESPTCENRHPGFEMLLPIDNKLGGVFEIELQPPKGEKQIIRLRPRPEKEEDRKSDQDSNDWFAFYDSRCRHKITYFCPSDHSTSGKALVFRFLDRQSVDR
jgi:hypothetical protein